MPYLNARPLIYGIEDRVTLCESARLADLMYRRQFDVGLVPVAEILRHNQYDITDGIAIAGRGPVKSVFLAHRVPIEQIKRVAVDPASRSSAWLVRVILKYGYHIEPEFYPLTGAPKLSDHEAMMLFGDGAIWYRHRNGDDCLLDLGEAWTEMTGLPFVFAAWAVQKGVESGERGARSVKGTRKGDRRREEETVAAGMSLPELLRAAKADGLAHVEEIVQESTEGTAEFRREYLTRNVVYELGEREKQGIRRFQQYLREMGLIEAAHDLRYIS
ncbi:MAG TPA: menaquinone biosynthesis protein [Verrucomicrobiae bacterium]|nr:menaquinone biosynthesis protein [Verrucomicrobiae bacterium]